MADDAATIATGPRSRRADRRRRRRVAGGRARRAASAACRSNSCAPIRAIRAAFFPRPSSTNSPLRSASAASSSRSWCAARGTDSYEIIAGERRWRAAQRAGLHDVPIVVLDVSDAEALELAIIENVQRADLNPLEEATGYQALANEYNHSQDDIAKIVGKSRSHVANTLRLLEAVRPGQGLHRRRQAHRRSRAHAGRPARTPRRSRPTSSSATSTCARSKRWRARAAASRRERFGAPARIKDADTEALENRLTEALGSAGHHRTSPQWRWRSAGALSHAGAARRRCEAAGERAEKSRHRH